MKRTAFRLLLCIALAFSSCENRGGGEGDTPALVEVQLALRVGGERNAQKAKGNPSIITEMAEGFRGVEGVTLLPFSEQRDILEGDRSCYHPLYMPDITSLIANNHAFLYPSEVVFLPGGTASVLAYGYAPLANAATEVERLHLNGALTQHGMEPMGTYRTAGDIGFSPVPIYGEGIPAQAGEIAGLLSSIVGQASTTTTYYYQELGAWKSGQVAMTWDGQMPDLQLRNYFDWITNGGQLTTGAGHSVEYMLTRLYILLKDYVSYDTAPYEHVGASGRAATYKTMGESLPLTYADLYNGVRDLVVGRIEALRDEGSLTISQAKEVSFADANLSQYPAAYGLPDGAAVLRWDGIRFTPVLQTLDGVAPLDAYCYPPRLWYYANTTLITSGKDLSSAYVSENASWTDDILSLYRSGHVVRSYTQSVALEEPLQFGCGMLEVSVRAGSIRLDDADDSPSTYVTPDVSNLPVTGVIVGGQESLGYDFTPCGGDEYYLYDNCISGVYVRPVTSSSAPSFRTLVSQTPDNQDIYFCLELRNDTGKAFTGADGLVLPGGKFYLLGSIELPEDHSCERAFEKDHITRVNCTIGSLREARTAVPDLEHPTLSMGLQVGVNWIESTSSYVILY